MKWICKSISHSLTINVWFSFELVVTSIGSSLIHWVKYNLWYMLISYCIKIITLSSHTVHPWIRTYKLQTYMTHDSLRNASETQTHRLPCRFSGPGWVTPPPVASEPAEPSVTKNLPVTDSRPSSPSTEKCPGPLWGAFSVLEKLANLLRQQIS